MDSKGLISIEYLFSLFIVIIIASSVLFFSSSAINSSLNIEDSVTHRLILDDVAGKISQVNSNGEGYSKYIELPSERGYFEITVKKDKLILEYDNKKAESPLPIINIDENYKLVSGGEYYITKADGRIVIS